MKACALLSPFANSEQKPPTGDMSAAQIYARDGVILSVSMYVEPRELILALRELERLAIEDYLRRTADGGGT